MTRAESIYNAITDAIGPPKDGAEAAVMQMIQDLLDNGLFTTVSDEVIAAYCKEAILGRIAGRN